MTFTKTTPMPLERFFNMFYKYWDLASKRGTEYTAFEVLLMTSVLFMHLRTEWEKLEWDVEELKWIFAALDNDYEDLDPNYFVDCKFGYLDHLKTCYSF